MQKSTQTTTPPKTEVVKPIVETVKPTVTNKVITLDFPVIWAGETYTQLTVRRVKAKDFRKLDMIDTGGGNAAAIAMAALICGVDEAIIDELDATDYLKVQEAIADFFPSALVAKLQAKASAS